VGVTIHYSGQLDDPGRLSELLLGVEHFCFKRGWAYRKVDERIIGQAERFIFNEVDASGQLDDGTPINWQDVYCDTEVSDVDDHIRGLTIDVHPDCETVHLLFNRQGLLKRYEPQAPGYYTEWGYFFVKTQFAPIEVHIAVCELLRFVKDNYMPGLEVRDEGWYWETGDREKLAMYLGFINDKMRELMETRLKEFKQFLDEKHEGGALRIEMGKKIEVREPLWKEDWGQSAGEN
jgi:hypothetical protein